MSGTERAGTAARAYWPTLLLPLATHLDLVTAPHRGGATAAVVVFLAGLVVADRLSPSDRARPDPTASFLGFEALLLALAILQVSSLGLFLHVVARGDARLPDLVAMTFLVGVNSGYSAIVVAHELIHRPTRRARLVGQALLATVLYGHFFVEHLRGHHRRVATLEDPATARFGESFCAFLPRSVAGQLRSAVQIERERIGTGDGRSLIIGWPTSPLVVGCAAQMLLLACVAQVFGVLASQLLVGQALVAISCLEAANYVEHWGLVRRQGVAVQETDSWDTDSRFSRRALLALPRHADHHLHAGRPSFALQLTEQSPKLPYGHFAAIFLALVANRRFRAMARRELEAKRLGPFGA